jgi:hypothetical protein
MVHGIVVGGGSGSNGSKVSSSLSQRSGRYGRVLCIGEQDMSSRAEVSSLQPQCRLVTQHDIW